MSKVVPSDITIPAHLANSIGQPSKLSAALAGGLTGGANYPRISIKGSRFCIVEGGAETVLEDITLSVVIVGANPHLSKTYYAKQPTPDREPASPDCFSLDGIRPDPESTEPQNDLCANCPMNTWGSKITPSGQQKKACADHKRLAVVSANDPAGPIYLLQVTLASLINLRSYQKELSKRGIPLEIVNTAISFDYDESGDPTLIFRFGRFLDENEYNISKELVGSDKIHEVTGEQVTQEPAADPQRNEKGTFIPTSETSLLSDDSPWDLPELDEAGEDLADDPDSLTAAQWLMANYEPHEVISTYYSRVIDGTKNIYILATGSAKIIDKLGEMLEADRFIEGMELEFENLLSNKFLKLKELIEDISNIETFYGQGSSRNKHIEDTFDAFEALERVSSLSKEMEKNLRETLDTLIFEVSDLERKKSEKFRSTLDDLMLANAGIEGISYYFSMANDLHETTNDCIDKVMMIPGNTLVEPLGEGQVSQEDENYCEILERLAGHGIDWSEATKAFEKLISWPKERWET